MSILLAASWVFSLQPVLPPVSRPLFVVNDEAGQAIDAVTGTRRLGVCLSFLRMLLFYAAAGIANPVVAAVMPRFVDFSLLVALESPSEQIREYNEQIEKLAQDSYPQIEPLKQITQNAAVF